NGSPQKPRRIDCPLDLLDGGIVDRNGTVLASPFALDKGEAEERFLSLLDAATEERRIIVPGRVNVNEASRSVLEAIPGLSEQAVSAILARRGRFGETRDKRFRHPCWLLSEGILDRETLRTLWPRITTGGDVWRTQIVAFYDGKGPGSRLEVVLDGTVKPPKQVFLKDLTLYGIGYPDSVLMGRRDGYQ
ncbi:MAG TPA: hypothetical protein DEB39_08025, partial [Planctomycetaceae bacterium]|nr:hypothetical protein [Planctomycetaceae bacterium]